MCIAISSVDPRARREWRKQIIITMVRVYI